jgi:hypothetical protein
MDPIGYGYGSYDAVGRYQAFDVKNRPIDVSGTVHAMDSKSVDFDGPLSLAKALASSAEVRSCAATQWLRFALGRGVEPGDASAEASVRKSFAASDYQMNELLMAIAASDAMRFRTPAKDQ